MRYKGIWLLVGGVIALGMFSHIGAASFPTEHYTPIDPSLSASRSRRWAGVTLTQTQPDIIKEKRTMSGTPIPLPLDPALQRVVTYAKQDLARRLAIPEEQIELVEVLSVVWPDKGLGCPQPGMVYLQVQVDGLLIRFRADRQIYEYHSGGNRPPFLCENPLDASGKR